MASDGEVKTVTSTEHKTVIKIPVLTLVAALLGLGVSVASAFGVWNLWAKAALAIAGVLILVDVVLEVVG